MGTNIEKAVKRAAPMWAGNRLCGECLALLLLCSWAFNMYTHLQLAECNGERASQRSQGQLPAVAAIVAHNGGYWHADPSGLLRVASDDPPGIGGAFHFERDGTSEWFCLRWIANMRLVEVVLLNAVPVPKGTVAIGAHMLRLSPALRFGCHSDAQRFSLRGQSLYSKGAASFINVRSGVHLRAHSDIGPPWVALRRETLHSQVALEEAPMVQRDVLSRGFADIVRRLEESADNRSRLGGVSLEQVE